jgi:hypothetical protein
MLHIYHAHAHPVSEELLLGIGSGLGFVYWHQRGAPPMLGGRGNVGRPGEDGLEITAGRRTGVHVERHSTGSARKAEAALVQLLEAGEPVMLQVDMGFLPYVQGLPEGYHFGYHVISVGGYDPDSRRVLVADRDAPLHPVSLADLARARGSTYKPFPPRNTWYTFDFSGRRPPIADEVRQALGETCGAMLEAPIANLGVRGIRKAAAEVSRWPQRMSEADLRLACQQAFLFIDAAGGTGGGIFRRMYARFLYEAAVLLGDPGLDEAGRELHDIAEAWQEIAALFSEAGQDAGQTSALSEIPPRLNRMAEREAALWGGIRARLGSAAAEDGRAMAIAGSADQPPSSRHGLAQ